MKLLFTLCFLSIFALSGFSQTVVTTEKVYFNFDEYTVTAESEATLQTLIQDERPIIEVFIEANTDPRGSIEYNIKLGQNRANAVKDYLINNGVDAHLVTILNHGENKPIFENDTEDGMAKNRRVDIKVVYKNFVQNIEVVEVEQPVKPHYDFLTSKNTNDVFDFYEALKPESERFIINNLRDTFLVTETGTVLEIPAKSFSCSCSETMFEIEIDEAITFKQMIQHGFITTDDAGNPLQTGGMVDIRAFSLNERRPVELNKDITINIPTAKPMDNMSYYIGSDASVSAQNQETGEVVTRNEIHWGKVANQPISIMTWSSTTRFIDEPCCDESCIVKESERRINYWKRKDKTAYEQYIKGLEIARRDMKERCQQFENRQNAFEQSMSNQRTANGRMTKTFYSLSTPSLSKINIDKLMKIYDNEELVTVNTSIPVNKAVDCFYISKKRRFIYRAFGGNQLLNIAKGEEITILGFGVNEKNEPVVAMLDVQAENKTYDLEFFKISNEELNQVLNSLK